MIKPQVSDGKYVNEMFGITQKRWDVLSDYLKENPANNLENLVENITNDLLINDQQEMFAIIYIIGFLNGFASYKYQKTVN